MPELPEVEVLLRHLAPLLRHRRIRRVQVRRAKTVAPTTPAQFRRALHGMIFQQLDRRGKYLRFTLRSARTGRRLDLLGHLGMTGRICLLPANTPFPRHTAVVLNLGRHNFVFEDARYFGRLTLDTAALTRLGPEPLTAAFTPAALARALQSSRQPVKVKLLDQSVVAGVGNIYASETLFRARLSPRLPADRLNRSQTRRLWRALRQTLAEAIRFGSTVPLDFRGEGKRDGLFYYGRPPGTPNFYEERLRVYDRAGQPCGRCRQPIRRLVQAGRSTFYCPRCQH
jgi:formamidopyrimidine-DNA glycosylase